jgi:hypothetical protein
VSGDPTFAEIARRNDGYGLGEHHSGRIFPGDSPGHPEDFCDEIIAVELDPDPDPIKKLTYGAQTPMIEDHRQDRNIAAYENILTPARSRFEPARRVEYLE